MIIITMELEIREYREANVNHQRKLFEIIQCAHGKKEIYEILENVSSGFHQLFLICTTD
jgi:hypothetical protein